MPIYVEKLKSSEVYDLHADNKVGLFTSMDVGILLDHPIIFRRSAISDHRMILASIITNWHLNHLVERFCTLLTNPEQAGVLYQEV